VTEKISFATAASGQRFVGPGRTLTETDHGLFMMLVGDWHPIHADEVYAKSMPFGRRVMHGSFGVALALGMQASLTEFADPIVGALGLESWKFAAPLFIGDTVHVEVEILGKRQTSRGDRGIVQRQIRLVNQSGAVVQEGRADVMLQLQPNAPSESESSSAARDSAQAS
jgi:acyl dehydratase